MIAERLMRMLGPVPFHSQVELGDLAAALQSGFQALETDDLALVQT